MNCPVSKIIAFALTFFLLVPLCQAQAYKVRSAIGTNLDSVTYYSTQVPFVDVMKSSSAWISGDSSKWDNKQPLDLDANGWVRSLEPGQIARILTLREIGDHHPAGQYLVRYKGRGTLKFEFDARVISEKPGEIVLQVTPSNAGIQLRIEATDASDYVRDIEITMPGGICDGDPYTYVTSARQCGSRHFLSFADNSKTILFNPVFLDRLRNYSVLRFKDWMQVDAADNPVTNWSQRTPLSYRTWTAPSGVPIEIMIELANRIGAHPWFSIPHKTDDAYARNFVQLIKAKLNPTLRIYIEHSNEVWNQRYSQYTYVMKQAAAQSPQIDNMQYHALRTRTLGGIFKEVLGSARVVTVLGAQSVRVWTAGHGLEYLKSRFGGALGIDALAIAPYFAVMPGPNEAGTYTAMTLDALFTFVRTNVLPAVPASLKDYRSLVNSQGLALIAYEGGQHLVGLLGAENNDALTALFIAFNRDPRIKQLYLDYLASWKQADGQLFVHYTDVGRYSKWGSWGALEYISQPRTAAPKFDAIQTFIERNPVWWTQ